MAKPGRRPFIPRLARVLILVLVFAGVAAARVAAATGAAARRRALVLRSGARPGGLRVLVLRAALLRVLRLIARALLLVCLVAATQLLVVLHVRRDRGAAAGGTLQIHVGAGARRTLHAHALRGRDLAERHRHHSGKQD